MGLGKSKPKLPVYDGPVQKRIQQFYTIKKCADELSREASRVADSFNVMEADGKKNHNVALGLSVRLNLHGTQTSKLSEQFGIFLASMSGTYDEISREQAIFQKEIHDKVIDPLQKWLQVEFKRMDAEINSLHSRKNQYEQAKIALNKKNFGPNQLMHELARKELELQMDIVKVELGKLRLIKDSHYQCLREMIKSLLSYHERVARILEAKKPLGG